jgi:hypothetical protein
MIEELQREQKIQNNHINRIYDFIEKLIAEPLKGKSTIGFNKS